jgi:hypothetical protein
MHRFAPYLWLLTLLAFCPTATAAGTKEPAISVIVSAGSATSILSPDEVALVFRRKKRLAADGQQIQPVNLLASHPLRRAFSLHILGQNPEELEDYWRELYFHGVLPPFVVASEEAVIRFVASTPGAIGYVSSCLVDSRVTVVLRFGASSECPR